MKKPKIEPIVKEYAADLKDDHLWYLRDYIFISKPVDYLYDLMSSISRDREMDHWLSSAGSADRLFEMLDMIENAVFAEIEAREKFQQQKDKKRSEPEIAK